MTDKKVITIDCNYLAPQFACSYLLIEGDRATFIENNTQFACSTLLSTLEKHGVSKENVENIIITHVHLDHAGGTSALAKECPNAVVLAHERAARHMINPEKLINGAKAVYGESVFNSLYGNIEPLDEKRIRIMNDGESIQFGERNLKFIYTLGHAKHHMCIYDSGSNGVFTGDSFGIALPGLQTGKRLFIFPTTSPPDFDADDALASIDTITGTGAEKVFLTHFGVLEDIKTGADLLKKSLNKIKKIIQEALESGLDSDSKENNLYVFCRDKMNEFFKNELEECSITLTPDSQKILEADINLNAQGIAFAANKIKKM